MSLINLALFKEILFVLFSAIGSIIAIIMFFRQKKDKQASEKTVKNDNQSNFKCLVVVCAVILVLYVFVSSYLAYVNRNRFSADLVISISEPCVVNYDGIEKDRFDVDANYCVVCMRSGFSVNAEINMKNIKTGETYSFKTYNLGEGFRIVDFPSGTYEIDITTREYTKYSKRIKLDRSNIDYDNGKNTWFFVAYAFDTLEKNVGVTNIELGDNKNNVSYYVFTITGGDMDSCHIFYTDIDWSNNGRLKGYFKGVPGTYIVHNAISDTEMEPFSVIIPEK